ncbi:MAG: YihA family ribosome biogenesis GTP-binding protein [Blastocatellia bacterium]
MKITSAEFILGAASRRDWPASDLREIAFLGRSNVGKSSLINSLLGRKNLARTSNTPGRTQMINFFNVENRLVFVDLPGYGYAKAPKNLRSLWGKMAQDYLSQRRNLVLCIQVIDARHDPTPLDIQLDEWLRVNQKLRIVVATKADKLSANKLFKSIRKIEDGLTAEKIIAYSSTTGKGRADLWSAIESVVQKN